jgi:glycosyltransferase involved in cell wall biosynthesis
MSSPLVSVLIPVFNAGKYLRPAVESILEQSYTNLEVIIIDDGSTDGCMSSIQDLKDPRIRVVCQSNAGKPSALNRALEIVSGEFYAVQDADDLSYSNRIERQVHCLQETLELAAVLTGWDVILNNRRMAPRFRPKGVEECRRDVERIRMPAHDPTAMYRMRDVKALRYAPTMRAVEGFDYILQVGEKFPMVVLGECLYSYRIHSNSLMHRSLDRTQSLAQSVLERAAERRGVPLESTLLDSPASRRRWNEYGLVAHFMESVLDLRRARQLIKALATAWQCLRLRPFDKIYYKPLVYALLPETVISFYRTRKLTSA